jgi:hypothetical protein
VPTIVRTAQVRVRRGRESEMGTKWKKRTMIGLASAGVLVLAGVLAFQYAQGAALRGFHDGRLQAAD